MPDAVPRLLKIILLSVIIVLLLLAVISRYLANPAPFDQYLCRCDEEADAVRRKLESAGMINRVGKEELLERARVQELVP